MPWIFFMNADGTGTLQSDSGKQWKAISGPHGNGKLEPGKYIIEKPIRTNQHGMVDKTGFGWKAQINPQFKTNRTLLRIHPDGAEPGTQGCIGIAKGQTESTQDVYAALMGSNDLNLIVIDKSAKPKEDKPANLENIIYNK